MAKSPKTAAVVDDPSEALPTFEIAERMAQHGTVAELRESEVEDLLDESRFPRQQEIGRDGRPTGRTISSYVTTWVHAAETGRLHHVVNVLGWRPVLAKWLKSGTMSGAWTESPEGYLTRGEKGEDVACLMPRKFHEERTRKMALQRSERARDAGRIKSNAAESLAAEGNERGAERVATARLEVTAFHETKGIGAATAPGDNPAALVPESER